MLGFSGGIIIAVKPTSPLKIKFVTPDRFSPEKVISPVEPRCSQSWETELSLGTGWAQTVNPDNKRSGRQDFFKLLIKNECMERVTPRAAILTINCRETTFDMSHQVATNFKRSSEC